MTRGFPTRIRGTQALLLTALGGLCACSTGSTLINGQDQFGASTAAQSSGAGQGNAQISTGANAGAGANGSSANGNAATNAPSSSNVAYGVGLEIDSDGKALDGGYWMGALQAVMALAPSAQPLARVVVAHYAQGQVALDYDDDGTAALPTGPKGVVYGGDQGTEGLLAAADAMGASVLVEVQPGTTNVAALAAAVLQHFAKHKSVVGVSINGSLYGSSRADVGDAALDDETAQKVIAAVRRVAPNGQVVLRHYTSRLLPKTARSGLTFALDATGFSGLSDMTSDYARFAETFAPAPVQWIVAGGKDTGWTCKLAGGAQALIAAAGGAASNVSAVYWAAPASARLFPANVFSCLN